VLARVASYFRSGARVHVAILAAHEDLKVEAAAADGATERGERRASGRDGEVERRTHPFQWLSRVGELNRSWLSSNGHIAGSAKRALRNDSGGQATA
jgi:hypothetical protein